MFQSRLHGGTALQQLSTAASIPQRLESFICASKFGGHKGKAKQYAIFDARETCSGHFYNEKDTKEGSSAALQEETNLHGPSQEAMILCYAEILEIFHRCQRIGRKQDNRSSSYEYQWLFKKGAPRYPTITFRAAVLHANALLGEGNGPQEITVPLPVSMEVLEGMRQLTYWTYYSCMALHSVTKHSPLEHHLDVDWLQSLHLTQSENASHELHWLDIRPQRATHAPECIPLEQNHIRVIELSSGEISDPLDYKWKTIDLDDPPEYDVVSYLLGTSSKATKDCRIIDCAARTSGSSFKISAEYDAVLRKIRCQTNRKLLWMDALCITRNSTFGIDPQIQLIPQIYRLAAQVEVFVSRAANYGCEMLGNVRNLSWPTFQKTPEPAKDADIEAQSADTEKGGVEVESTEISISSSKKRKAKSCQGDEDEDDDSDEKGRKTGTTNIPNKDKQERRLACPYFKRNPEQDPRTASCIFPGYQTIARLKEHLYRHHMLPIHCPRCYETFQNDGQMTEHLNAIERCPQNSNRPTIEGISKEQAVQLKSKKRQKGADSQEEKWRIIYQILFPEDSDKIVPSPFCEHDMAFAHRQPLSSSEKLASVLDRCSKQKLADVLKQNFEQELNLGAVEVSLGGQLPEIINKSVDQWFSGLQKEVKSVDSTPIEDLKTLYRPVSLSRDEERLANAFSKTSKHTTDASNERPTKFQKSTRTDSGKGFPEFNSGPEGQDNQDNTQYPIPKGVNQPMD